ncbi:hypothetical protein LY76DRAFT_29835 [Colletotrichum caudatum]|nr:hypothetical protein LY76DRAFT_29835 [Colletotrichum caudatum]
MNYIQCCKTNLLCACLSSSSLLSEASSEQPSQLFGYMPLVGQESCPSLCLPPVLEYTDSLHPVGGMSGMSEGRTLQRTDAAKVLTTQVICFPSTTYTCHCFRVAVHKARAG